MAFDDSSCLQHWLTVICDGNTARALKRKILFAFFQVIFLCICFFFRFQIENLVFIKSNCEKKNKITMLWKSLVSSFHCSLLVWMKQFWIFVLFCVSFLHRFYVRYLRSHWVAWSTMKNHLKPKPIIITKLITSTHNRIRASKSITTMPFPSMWSTKISIYWRTQSKLVASSINWR